MDETDLHDIIDFAIEREREAVRFYRDLKDRPDFSGKRDLLLRFVRMEEEHVRLLENIREGGAGRIAVPEVRNLHLSDYLVPPPERGAKTYQDILLLAIKKEETAFRLYTDLASTQNREETRRIFLKLASEEAKHKLFFEEMYDDEILSQD
jgi:rubrerythrin